MTESIVTRRPVRLAAALAWTCLILVLCFLPQEKLPDSSGVETWLPDADKAVHLILFAILGGLWYSVLPGARRGLWAILGLWVAGTALGVGIEVVQEIGVSGRTGDVFDAVFDSLGMLLGVCGYQWAVRWSRTTSDVEVSALSES